MHGTARLEYASHKIKNRREQHARQQLLKSSNQRPIMEVKICSKNVDGKTRSMFGLDNLIFKHRPEIVMVQDPPGTPSEQIAELLKQAAPGYRAYTSRNLIQLHLRGQVMPNNTNPHQGQQNVEVGRFSAQLIEVVIKKLYGGKRPINIVNLYIRPRTSSRELNKGLAALETVLRSTKAGLSGTITIGDVNAASLLWTPAEHVCDIRTDSGETYYNNIRVNRGQSIEAYVQRTKQTIVLTARQGPTIRRNDGKDSYTDTAMMGTKVIRKLIECKLDHNDSSRSDENNSRGITTLRHQRRQQLQEWTRQMSCSGTETNSQATNAECRQQHTTGHKTIILRLKADSQNATSGEQTTTGRQEHTRNRKGYMWHKIHGDMFTELKIKHEEIVSQIRWAKLEDREYKDRLMNSLTDALYKTLTGIQERISYVRNATKPYSNYQNVLMRESKMRIELRKLELMESKLRALKQKRKTDERSPANRGRTRMQENQKRGYCREQQQQRAKKLEKRSRKIRQSIMNKIRSNKVMDAVDKKQRIEQIDTVTKVSDSGNNNSQDRTWMIYQEIERQEEEMNSNNNNENGNADTTRLAIANNKEELDKLANSKFPQTRRAQESKVTEAKKKMMDEPTDVIGNEIDRAIKEVESKTYKGPEGLSFRTFNACIPHTRKIIEDICKLSMLINELPRRCQETRGTIIPKKAPGQYRIVHVGTPLAGVLERVALYRLEYALEANRLLNKQQYGFTALKGRNDMVAKVVAGILGYNKQQENSREIAKTSIIGLDINSAFDEVDQDLLINKLLEELRPHSIRFWLASYVLSRKIRVEYKGLRSELRNVCQGVPQGSPLGPILWNMMINELDKEIGLGHNNRNTLINNPTVAPKTANSEIQKTELLLYADDLVLIHHYTNGALKEMEASREVQRILDRLTNRLTEMRLRVRAEKCTSTTIVYKTQRRRRQCDHRSQGTVNDYRRTEDRGTEMRQDHDGNETALTVTIEGQMIPKTNTVKILGIPISNKLLLDTSDRSLREKIANAVGQLHKTKQIGVIHTTKQWNVLINSVLMSRIIDGNIPMLAVDRRALKWADKTIDKSLRLIFGWNTNSSNRVPRLLLGWPASKTIVRKAIEKRMYSEHFDSYKILLEELEGDGRRQTIGRRPTNSRVDAIRRTRDFSNGLQWLRRRYANPNGLPYRPRVVTLNDTIGGNGNEDRRCIGPIWVVREQGSHATACEILGNKVMTTIRGQHTGYPIAHFNGLSLIRYLARTRQERRDNYYGCYATESNNGSATTTTTAIDIRRQIGRSKKIAFTRSNSIYQAIRNMDNHDWRVIELRERLCEEGWEILILEETEMECAKEIMVENERKQTAQAEQGGDSEQAILRLAHPPLRDYSERNLASKRTKVQEKIDATAHQTTLMRLLCPKIECWSQSSINIGWISSKTMLMLSGLIKNQEEQADMDGGSLLNGTITNGSRPNGCTTSCAGEHEGGTNNANEEASNQTNSNSGGGQQRRLTAYEKQLNQHNTLHRAFICPRYEKTVGQEVRRTIGNANRHGGSNHATSHHQHNGGSAERNNDDESGITQLRVERTLKHRMYGQTLLRLLAKAAFSDQRMTANI